MDESTAERMEVKRLREMDSDYAIGLVENHYFDKMDVSLVDVINYVYEQTRKGISRVIIKDKWLQEVADPKISELNVDLSKIDIDVDMQTEMEKYNY